MGFSEEFLEKLAAEILQLLKGGISGILQASSICEQAKFDLNKDELALLLKKLHVSRSKFWNLVSIYNIEKYGKGHTHNLPGKISTLCIISRIQPPEIKDMLGDEIFTKNMFAYQVLPVAKRYCFLKYGRAELKFRKRGLSKYDRSKARRSKKRLSP